MPKPVSPGSEEGMGEFLEGPCPVRERVFRSRLHLAEGLRPAFRDEDRIVSEPFAASRWPCERSPDYAFERLDVAVRPSHRQGARKVRACPNDATPEPLCNVPHRKTKVFAGPGPARRED